MLRPLCFLALGLVSVLAIPTHTLSEHDLENPAEADQILFKSRPKLGHGLPRTNLNLHWDQPDLILDKGIEEDTLFGAQRVSKVKSLGQLNLKMQHILDSKLELTYNQDLYQIALKEQLCQGLLFCNVTILSDPIVEFIPAHKLDMSSQSRKRNHLGSGDSDQDDDDEYPIYCPSSKCHFRFQIEDAYLSTIHRAEEGFSTQPGAKPFQIGVKLDPNHAHFGFSDKRSLSTELAIKLDLQYGEKGYIALVGAQITALVQLTGCHCTSNPWECAYLCVIGSEDMVSELGYHEAILMAEIDKPFVIPAFVSR